MKQRRQKQIEYTIRYGKHHEIPGGFIVLSTIPQEANAKLENNHIVRYAMSISKKYAKSAVKRNNIRRKLKGVLFDWYREHPMVTSFIVIVLKSPVTDISSIINEVSSFLGTTIH